MRNRLEMKDYSPLLNLSFPFSHQVLKISDYWMHLSIPSYSSLVRHWILQQNSVLPSKHNNKNPQHWRTEVLLHLPLRSLLKSWSLRISPSSLFLMAFSRASRLEDDFSRFLYASETCWISVSSCSGSENKHLLFFTNKFHSVSDRRLLCLKCSLLRETYTYTLSKRKSQVCDESLCRKNISGWIILQ